MIFKRRQLFSASSLSGDSARPMASVEPSCTAVVRLRARRVTGTRWKISFASGCAGAYA